MELHEALRKDGVQTLFVSRSDAREVFFFLRIDTSLFRSACWTLASGMRLEVHVKSQCGEIRKFDWCCEIRRFHSKRALRCHQLRSKRHGHGRQTSVLAGVITNYCPWCHSTFSTTLIARKHAAASLLSGRCRVDWPISPPKSLQCSSCDKSDMYTSIDNLYDHSVAAHLPKPSPVSLPIATASHHPSDARGDSSDGRSLYGGRGEETQVDSTQVGG